MSPILCLEGPSAVGKTTLARELETAHGAAVVPELDASGAPPISSAEPWFTDRHAELWRRARALAAAAPLVVIDGDPMKGLWYNWMHAEAGWPQVDALAPLYRERVRRGELGFPDLYVYLDATEAQLRARKEGDATRKRRGFDGNLRMVEPQRRYFDALRALAPDRVTILDTADRGSLAARVAGFAAAPPVALPASSELLEFMIGWVRDHRPCPVSSAD